MRLVNVRMWDLTDQELEDLATHCEATEPDHAAALRHLKAWRQAHPQAPLPDQTSRRYQVLRGRFQT